MADRMMRSFVSPATKLFAAVVAVLIVFGLIAVDAPAQRGRPGARPIPPRPRPRAVPRPTPSKADYERNKKSRREREKSNAGSKPNPPVPAPAGGGAAKGKGKGKGRAKARPPMRDRAIRIARKKIASWRSARRFTRTERFRGDMIRVGRKDRGERLAFELLRRYDRGRLRAMLLVHERGDELPPIARLVVRSAADKDGDKLRAWRFAPESGKAVDDALAATVLPAAPARVADFLPVDWDDRTAKVVDRTKIGGRKVFVYRVTEADRHETLEVAVREDAPVLQRIERFARDGRRLAEISFAGVKSRGLHRRPTTWLMRDDSGASLLVRIDTFAVNRSVPDVFDPARLDRLFTDTFRDFGVEKKPVEKKPVGKRSAKSTARRKSRSR